MRLDNSMNYGVANLVLNLDVVDHGSAVVTLMSKGGLHTYEVMKNWFSI